MPASSNRRATRCLALSSVLSALGVILLYLGSVIEIFDLTAVALVSLIVVFSVIELKGRYPVMIWGVTSFLSLLLLPNKFGALCYACLCGYYPMVKPYLERLPRVWSFVLKFLGFNLILAGMLAAAVYVFMMPREDAGYIWALIGLGNAAFFLYDLAITRLSLLYFLRFRRMLKIDKYLNR